MKKWHPLYSHRVQYVNELMQKKIPQKKRLLLKINTWRSSTLFLSNRLPFKKKRFLFLRFWKNFIFPKTQQDQLCFSIYK